MYSITPCVVRGKDFFFKNSDSVTNIERKLRLYFDSLSRGKIVIHNTIMLLRTLDSINHFVVVKLECKEILEC